MSIVDGDQLHARDLTWQDIGRPLRVRAVHTAGGAHNAVLTSVRRSLEGTKGGYGYDGITAYVEGVIRSISFGGNDKVEVSIGREDRSTSLVLDVDCEVWL